jgi:class 3 adenylate cyclase
MVRHKKYTSLILFADLVGSSEVGNTLTPEAYWDVYVSNFYAAVKVAQKIANLQETPQCHVRLVGDECVIFCQEDNPTPDKFLTDQVHKIVRFTYILKALWFVSPFNIKRMEDHKSPREIAVGAHCGTILEIMPQKENGIAYENNPWFLGHTINVAKRIESISRERRNLNFCVSASVGNMVNRLAKTAERGEFKPEYIVYGLLKVADPEHRDIKGIDPVIRVNEILPSWDRDGKTNSKIEHATKIITQFRDDEKGDHVSNGSRLISEYYRMIQIMRGEVPSVSKLLTPLIEYANWYAHDSWSVMFAGFSLLSMAELNGVESSIATEAKKTGKDMMHKLLDGMKSQEDASKD